MIKEDEVIGWLQSSMGMEMGIPPYKMGNCGHRDRQKHQENAMCKGSQRWGEVSTSQGRPEVASNPLEARTESKNRLPPPLPSEGTKPVNTLIRAGRGKIPVISAAQSALLR